MLSIPPGCLELQDSVLRLPFIYFTHVARLVLGLDAEFDPADFRTESGMLRSKCNPADFGRK